MTGGFASLHRCRAPRRSALAISALGVAALAGPLRAAAAPAAAPAAAATPAGKPAAPAAPAKAVAVPASPAGKPAAPAAPAKAVAVPASPAGKPAAPAPAGLGPVAAPAATPAVAIAAQPGAAGAADPLRVEVLTFGPGDHPFTRFGHNAIRIADSRAGTDIVYNFGTFTFDSPRLVLDFLKGRLRYWLSRSSYASTMYVYKQENRSIETQVLDLSPEDKRLLAERLEVNARPEYREYRYDYFRDNCSTRVRDAIDGVVGGRLRTAAAGPGSMSLRAHALRMAAENFPLYLGLSIVLGPSTDRPTTRWAEAFLPEMLQRSLRDVKLGDGASARPLVSAERVDFTAARPPVPREPPRWFLWFLAAGLGMGGLLYLLGVLGARFAVLRFLFGALVALLGLVLGFVGCFLIGSWALTPHAVVYRNENVLLFAPFAIALVVLGWGAARARPGATSKTFLVSASALGLAVAACALKLFPWTRQDNSALIGLLLPVWLGMTLGARALLARARVGAPLP